MLNMFTLAIPKFSHHAKLQMMYLLTGRMGWRNEKFVGSESNKTMKQ
jgi:hypothetical protein